MESIAWYGLAYLIGTIFGLYVGRNHGISKGILITLETLVNEGYLKTRKDSNGDLDLMKLTFEEKLDENK